MPTASRAPPRHLTETTARPFLPRASDSTAGEVRWGTRPGEHDRVWYHANLREGRTALSVLVRSDAEREQVADILEEFNPLDLHDETTAGIGGATRISPEVRSGYAAGTADQVRAEAAGTTEQTEQVIPVVKEELAVGKTASERRYRIRTYVVETPGGRAGEAPGRARHRGTAPRIRHCGQ